MSVARHGSCRAGGQVRVDRWGLPGLQCHRIPLAYQSLMEGFKGYRILPLMSFQNQQLATLLTAIANLLSRKRENHYRVRAYRRAAESVLQLKEDISAVARRGELLTIPGIGKDLSSKVEEFLSTGSLRTYEELKSPLPLEVKAWMDLPGFSEPLVHDLYFRLRITTLDDLEQLVRSHLIRTVPGIILQTEEVLHAIQSQREKINKETH